MLDLWWKNGLVYCLDTKTWLDGNGDGIGDLAGLASSVDYLAGLGVTCVWLMPVCPSPWRDDGYDVSDYYSVDPRLGTLGDFVSFVHAAHAAGIRVVLDLPLNHTSIEHPWFQAARESKESPFRDYYVWSDEPPPNPPPVVFPGEQESTFTYDSVAGQYYVHRYYSFMPELNTSNPLVRKELYKILGFWLALGVDGFRIDSLPFLVEEIADGGGEEASHEYLRDMRSFLGRRKGSTVLVGEANLPAPQLLPYFGKSGAEQMQVLFDFFTCAGAWTALATGSAAPLIGKLRERPEPPPICQYLTFLRHHDELSFEHVLSKSDAERVFDRFAPEENHRAYGRGIRRRLASMLDGDPARIRLALSLLLSLPGTPMLLYGDEIGLGDNLELDGRLACRTLMQWNNRENGGFSPASTLVRPAVADGSFGYRERNVGTQLKNPNSLLHWVRRAAALRRQCPEIGDGVWKILDTGDDSVLALRYRGQHDLVVAHNLSDRRVETHLPDLDGADDIFADGEYAAPKDGRLELAPHGFRWLRRPLLSTEVVA